MRRFEDLVCWQLSHELACEVGAFTSQSPAARDFKYCDQIRQSSASAASNIAEAFGRYRTADEIRFCEYAVASLDETRNHLIVGRQRGYLSPELGRRLPNLARAARRATIGWIIYLRLRRAEESGR